MIADIFYGFVFGVANIIPGVSGGTMALVFGFYERLLHVINGVNKETIVELAKVKLRFFLKPNKENRTNLASVLAKGDWFFVMRLVIGMGIAIAGLSALLKKLLATEFEMTYAFFFGLILFSIPVPWKLLKQKSWKVFLTLALGISLTIALAQSVNPVDQARTKSEIYQQKIEIVEEGEQSHSVEGLTLLKAFGAGAISVSAMVLPGISGSLVLILLGQYSTVLGAVSRLKNFQMADILLLGFFGIGMVIGLLVISRMVEKALARFHDPMMGFLTGLIIGSLWVLWPFKSVVREDLWVRGEQGIELVKNHLVHSNENILPQTGQITQWLAPLALTVVGCLLMLFFMYLEKKRSNATN